MREMILAEVKWVFQGVACLICESSGKEYTLQLPMGKDLTRGRSVRVIVIPSMGLAVKLV